ncbi:hypothetical protein [Parvularcula lutaonensis]|uniref:Uncharacterized protein n=1 Tax=Parvularcula lutaonensis TaxID=491923 RepID=A0ABV7MAC2_9PROT|nr:hypothetical protein [Parvularcula lutaonensis]GGY37473.1 hypothetical protein GCM10007148_02160 [Parvularcula lutaonensis]
MYRIVRVLLLIGLFLSTASIAYFFLVLQVPPPPGAWLAVASSLFGLIFSPRD